MIRSRPLVIVWTTLALVGGLSLARSRVPVIEPELLFAIGAAWGALLFAGVRTQALLQASLRAADAAPNGPDAKSQHNAERPHRLAPLLPPAALVGSLAGLTLGGGLWATGQVLSPAWALIITCPLLTPPLVYAALRVFRGDLTRHPSPRVTSLARWILVDTALPSAIICAPFSAGFAWLRLRAEAGVVDIDPVSISRHFALTFVIWGLCLGTAAFMKVRRERLSNLVDAPISTAVIPSPPALAGILAIILLVVGPRVLPPLSLDVLVVSKGILGFFLGGLLSALGAARGARDPAETIRPR